MSNSHILIARTDSIGDVMLTLPLLGVLKESMPGCTITFIGRSYTKPVIAACQHADGFLNWDEIEKKSPAEKIEALRSLRADAIIHVFPRKDITWVAKRAHIPIRVASGRRWYTLGRCNRLVFFTRRNSPLHESQLNLKLLEGLRIYKNVELSNIPHYYGFQATEPLDESLQSLLSPEKINVILHPLSKGSAVNWGIDHFNELMHLLPAHTFNIFITGTKAEGEQLAGKMQLPDHAKNLCGACSLEQLIAFIGKADALVAASTGPLHIAAALHKHAIGLYTPLRPMHPGRWAPVGSNAHVFVAPQHPTPGEALAISPTSVADYLIRLSEEKGKGR